MKPARRFEWHVWGWPIVAGFASLAGLLCALVGDGAWDIASWLLLGGLTIVSAGFGLGFFARRVQHRR
ncbi:hypothetical protein [Niveibacterium sp. SC-1]|uniref:hypothetical protein n=1 Tax=Niveibacterium sp. SC-1 TaxID=3135646 RepID=UPI00311D76AB